MTSYCIPEQAKNLNPYQTKLLVHYGFACQESPDGKCADTTRELAVACQMSTGMVSKARRELSTMGFIDLIPGRGDKPMSCSLSERYLCSSGERVHGVNTEGEKVVQEANESVHTTNDTVHEGESNPLVRADQAESLKLLNKLPDQISFTDQSQDKDKDNAREEKTERLNAFSIWEQTFGALSYTISNAIKDWVANYPVGWPEDAIPQAKREGGKSTWDVQGVLDRWRKSGKGAPKPTQPTKPQQPAAQQYTTPKGGVGLPWNVYQEVIGAKT